MKIRSINRVIYVICLGGLMLHLKTAFWESSEVNSFALQVLAFSLLPYLIILAFRKSSYGALCAAIVIFLFDLYMHLEVFVWPSSSTAALGLLFLPLWNLVLFLPISFLAGKFLEKRLKREK